MFYAVQLHLQSGEQFHLQEHLIGSLHDEETSGIVIQTGTLDCDTLVQAKSLGDGFTSCACALVVQIPA